MLEWRSLTFRTSTCGLETPFVCVGDADTYTCTCCRCFRVCSGAPERGCQVARRTAAPAAHTARAAPSAPPAALPTSDPSKLVIARVLFYYYANCLSK